MYGDFVGNFWKKFGQLLISTSGHTALGANKFYSIFIGLFKHHQL